MLKKCVAVFVLLAALLAPSNVSAGRALFESSATVIKSVETSTWLSPRTYDVMLRGDDGKLFLLHFHGDNPLEKLQGSHVYIEYIQQYSSCQTGFVDELVTWAWAGGYARGEYAR